MEKNIISFRGGKQDAAQAQPQKRISDIIIEKMNCDPETGVKRTPFFLIKKWNKRIHSDSAAEIKPLLQGANGKSKS